MKALTKSEKETLIYLIGKEKNSLPHSPVGDILKENLDIIRMKLVSR